MIEALLPGAAAVAEGRGEDDGAVLFPEEQELVAKAVEKRRREFAGGRACAHRALERLGATPRPIPAGPRGEPIWPPGVVGSITHCRGYRGCAVARAVDLATIGIDAEPHEPLPEGLIRDVARPEELGLLADLADAEPEVHWQRLLFSAKEAVYKAWYPLAERWLGFEDATIAFEPVRRRFSARLLVTGPAVGGTEIGGFEGRWLVEDGLVLTAIALSR